MNWALNNVNVKNMENTFLNNSYLQKASVPNVFAAVPIPSYTWTVSQEIQSMFRNMIWRRKTSDYLYFLEKKNQKNLLACHS